MKIIKILDKNFNPDLSVSKYQKPQFIKWNFINDIKDIKETDTVIVTDLYLEKSIDIKCKKIAWLLEPYAINPIIYEFIKNNYIHFEYVLTHSYDLLNLNDNIKYVPNAMCWIKKSDIKIYKKNKFCSIIASGKDFTDGHKLRNKIVINRFNRPIDIYGYKYNPINYKLEGLKSYKFQIVVENSKINDYFSEKIIDCFVTGTIPIYYGCERIGKYFDVKGIITFDTLEELEDIINNLSVKDYENRKNAIKNNLHIANNYILAEDWIYKNLQNIL